MKKIYSKAISFIKENGTDLQKSLFRYVLGQEKKKDVVSKLQEFQNEDGGWANGLEIEYQFNISSIMTTSTALGYIYLFGLEDSILLNKTLKYLENTQNESGYWDDDDKIRQADIPPYYMPGSFIAYKTGMILKWLRRLEIKNNMIDNGYSFMINSRARIENPDMWTAIGYINAFSEYKGDSSQDIINWAVNILNQNNSLGEELNWQKIQGMIYDDDEMIFKLKDKVLSSIKDNQLENGAWPHQFGVYNQVWAAILIIRYLKMIEEV